MSYSTCQYSSVSLFSSTGKICCHPLAKSPFSLVSNLFHTHTHTHSHTHLTLAPPTSLAPPTLSMPPIRTSSSAAPDAANAMAMAAMFRGLHPPDGSFPNFLPPPGFPPFHPQLPGGEFRPRMPPFHGGPPPFPLLPGGPLDVPGMLPPPLDDRGLPLPPELGMFYFTTHHNSV